MDSLGRKCYRDKKYLYKYNGSCYVPSLGMIDDTFAATLCGQQSVQMNALINTFIESKKLYFNTKKCYVMHLGPQKDECCKLRVHDKIMQESTAEKYSGDMVSNLGNDENIEFRQKIGEQSTSEILSVLREIEIGGFYIKNGLIFRDAVLKCKVLLNSEVWHSLTDKQVSQLENIDKTYLRRILNSHSKVAIECLFLETGLLPYKYEIITRRCMYWWKLVNCEKSELIHRVYDSQRIASCQGDWVRLLDSNKKALGITLGDDELKDISRNKFKAIIKSKVEQFALIEINEMKRRHSKSSYLHSSSFKTADYLVDGRFSRTEIQLLSKLRSQTADLKINSPKISSDNLCSSCKLFPESQSHILQCPAIIPKLNLIAVQHCKLNEESIYGNIDEQLKIVKIYSLIFEERRKLMEESEDVRSDALSGQPMHITCSSYDSVNCNCSGS